MSDATDPARVTYRDSPDERERRAREFYSRVPFEPRRERQERAGRTWFDYNPVERDQ